MECNGYCGMGWGSAHLTTPEHFVGAQRKGSCYPQTPDVDTPTSHTEALHTHASHTRLRTALKNERCTQKLRTRTLRIRQTPHTLRPSDGQHTALSHLTHVHLSPAPCFPPSHIQHVYLKANTHLFSTRATHTHHRTSSYTHVSHGFCVELRTRMLRRPLRILVFCTPCFQRKHGEYTPRTTRVLSRMGATRAHQCTSRCACTHGHRTWSFTLLFMSHA
jgi:hypothetical protein